MKKTIHIIATCMLMAGFLCTTGCESVKSLFDFDGNGRIDPITYLQNADITVAWTDADGNTYNVDAVELGEQVVYNYIEKKTGWRFEIVDKGGIEIKDPHGYTVRIARKVE